MFDLGFDSKKRRPSVGIDYFSVNLSDVFKKSVDPVIIDVDSEKQIINDACQKP
jgi:hypothetical protein